MDFSILNFIQDYIKCDFLDFLFPIITHLGDAGFVWILIAVSLMFFKNYRKTGVAMAIGLVLGLIIGNIILKNLFGRLRPFEVAEGINLLIKAPKDPSFPSGHTLASFISATIVFINHKKAGMWLFVLAFLIAFSRLYLYVHFPTDVLFGGILGVVIANLSLFLYKKFQKSN
ncbi:MAG: phosphatase PAP2 family protein [Clostridia bacterium]|nr:phosphatase PAP2 family protein [Clostridia bacterium]